MHGHTCTGTGTDTGTGTVSIRAHGYAHVCAETHACTHITAGTNAQAHAHNHPRAHTRTRTRTRTRARARTRTVLKPCGHLLLVVERLPGREARRTCKTHHMGFKLLYYKIWIRDVFWLGPSGPPGTKSAWDPTAQYMSDSVVLPFLMYNV